jgi:hypothetical protein
VPFLLFLKSFEDLLYEMMSWMIFYPRTLWRCTRHPLVMMARGERELSRPPDDQFVDVLSPPIFLLLTVLIALAFQVALVGNSKVLELDSGLASLIQDNTSLILFRIVAFASLPMIASAFGLRVLHRPLDRVTLQPMFYAQSFATTPAVFLYSTAATLSRLAAPAADLTAGLILLAATIFYFAVEARWFTLEMKRGWVVGSLCALSVFLLSGLVLTATALLFAGG